jgi:hypothetical protein
VLGLIYNDGCSLNDVSLKFSLKNNNKRVEVEVGGLVQNTIRCNMWSKFDYYYKGIVRKLYYIFVCNIDFWAQMASL